MKDETEHCGSQGLPACVRPRQLESRTTPRRCFVQMIVPPMQLMVEGELWCYWCPSRALHTPSKGPPPVQLPHPTHFRPLPETFTIKNESARDKLMRNKGRTLIKIRTRLKKSQNKTTQNNDIQSNRKQCFYYLV